MHADTVLPYVAMTTKARLMTTYDLVGPVGPVSAGQEKPFDLFWGCRHMPTMI